MFLILEGRVRVLGGAPHRAHVVHTEGAGGGLGEVPALDGGPCPVTALAAEPTTCVAFTADAIRAAIAADAALAWVFISRLILERHRDAGGDAFGLGGSQTAVAEELGTVREVVVRMLGDLRRAGIIRSVGRGRIEVTDLPALRRLAGRNAAQRPAGSATR